MPELSDQTYTQPALAKIPNTDTPSISEDDHQITTKTKIEFDQDKLNSNEALPTAILNEGDDDRDERSVQQAQDETGIDRPRKRARLEAPTFVPRSGDSDSESEESTQPQPVRPPAKRRGRPPKQKNQETTKVAKTAPSTRGRGRGRRSAPRRVRTTTRRIKQVDSDSDSGVEGGTESESETESDSDSDSEVAEFETETSEESVTRRKRAPRRRKEKIDRNFVEVSLTNIIRRRDVAARNPNAAKPTRIITRSKKPLNYKEESSEQTIGDTGPDSEGTVEKPKPAPKKKGRPRKVVSEPMKTTQIKPDVKQNIKQDASRKTRRRKNSSTTSTDPLPIINKDYSLSFVIEGHTNINVPVKVSKNGEENQSKDIWCCEFEPHRPGQVQTDVVALAGSYSVLFLDVQQGRYTKKYTHSESQEIFYCMAWTTLNIDEDSDSSSDEDEETCNVLAVGGRLGSIKLLNPLQNECYRYLFGHKDAILKMAFSASEPRWLFSASADKTVRLWDIGSPTSAADDSMCLAKFALPQHFGEPSALSVSFDLSTLIVGCSDGNLVRYSITAAQLKKFRSIVEQNDEERVTTIQPTVIYPSGDEWHEGYVDDIHIMGQDSDEKDPLYNHVVSRAEDLEIVIWDLAKSTPKDIEIYKSLKWPDSDGSTGLRFKVIEKNGQKILLAGDYEGDIHIFNVGDGQKSRTLPDNTKELFRPVNILSHEMSKELIRDVSCSADTRSIIAVDTNNNAFIWRCTDTV
ncbi:hypothetical protein RMATCC62417_09742 [Rhizopus microsporus]|nr:hypothetical protein RMATCC62417_09742 [Rhizopus microsporus]